MASACKVMKLGIGFPDKEEVEEIRNNTGHTIFRLGNQVVPDKEPNWDHQDGYGFGWTPGVGDG